MMNRIPSALQLPAMAKRPVIKYSGDSVTSTQDTVATEFALTIYVNGTEMATLVCTPEYMDDLVVGFLASEGVIRSAEQIEELTVAAYRGAAHVRTATTVNFNQQFYNKRYIASCCGKSRQSFYFYNDAHTAQHVDDPMTIAPDQVFRLLSRLEMSSPVFHETGGVHTAALCSKEGTMLTRTDIGRHNALDKLYGFALANNLSLEGSAIVFSGRLSSEILLKVAKIGVGVVLTKSAPTALALDMADELGITAIGFVRGAAFNVYTQAWRVRP